MNLIPKMIKNYVSNMISIIPVRYACKTLSTHIHTGMSSLYDIIYTYLVFNNTIPNISNRDMLPMVCKCCWRENFQILSSTNID